MTTSVNLTTDVRCHTCPGTGRRSRHPTGDLPALRRARAPSRTTRACSPSARSAPSAAGGGPIVTTPCPTCSGTGVEHRNRTVKVRIPPGVEDGQRIRVKGKGAAGRGNAPSGDLYVVVRVDRHGVFGRRGRNLTLTVPVSYPEAALGTTLTVPTLDEPVTLRVPPGTPSGRTFRVKGRGVPGRQAGRDRRPAGHRRGGGARDADRRAACRRRGTRQGGRPAGTRRTWECDMS